MRPAISPVISKKVVPSSLRSCRAFQTPSLRASLSTTTTRPGHPGRTLPRTGVSSLCFFPRRPLTTMPDPTPDRYKLIFYVPHSHLEPCKEAVFAAGAGVFSGGKYSKAAFQLPGTGQFLPGEGAKPALGAVGELEYAEEMMVQVMCVGRTVMLAAVRALVEAHPYEEVAYEVYKMENV